MISSIFGSPRGCISLNEREADLTTGSSRAAAAAPRKSVHARLGCQAALRRARTTRNSRATYR